MALEQTIFRRSELLLGDEAMSLIGEKRVIIFGVGGVGSWCAESLVRSGIRKLTIVDSDRVSITNINRQLCVYSDELLENKLPIDPDDKGNGSIVHITAVFGFILAGLVIQDAIKK